MSPGAFDRGQTPRSELAQALADDSEVTDMGETPPRRPGRGSGGVEIPTAPLVNRTYQLDSDVAQRVDDVAYHGKVTKRAIVNVLLRRLGQPDSLESERALEEAREWERARRP